MKNTGSTLPLQINRQSNEKKNDDMEQSKNSSIMESEPINIQVPKKLKQQGKNLSIDIVRDLEEYLMCQAIRSAVYIGEQKCPYLEEYDGNDFTATHVLAKIDGEPAATIRIRWFCGWFKIERLAVLKVFRQYSSGKNDSLGRSITQWSFELARRKGYQVGYGHIQLDLLKYWCCLQEVSEIPGQTFNFSDHAYTCVRFDLSANGPICNMTDLPMVLNRPEGKWHQSGPLDASTKRPAMNTHRQYRR